MRAGGSQSACVRGLLWGKMGVLTIGEAQKRTEPFLVGQTELFTLEPGFTAKAGRVLEEAGFDLSVPVSV